MIHVLSPGSPDQRTGGYRYNARVVDALRGRGHTVRVHALAGSWPFPDADAIRDGLACIRELEGTVVADGLLWTSLAAGVERPVVALVHSPLWREHGSDARRPEEAALARAARIVCTSRRIASDLDITPPVTVIEPGTDPAPAADRPGTGALLCVANVVPRKGHDVLIEAIRRVRVPVTLRCAGAPLDPAFAARVRAASRDLPVTWLGSLPPDALAEELSRTDLLVQAARYEGFGMAIAEALVRGVPVVSPPAGVLDHRRGGHRVVPADEPSTLALAIEELVEDRSRAQRMSREARSLPLPTWEHQGARWAKLLAPEDGR
ncbi:MAG: glycosyltransferase family 4 protein [Myxococcota bacterium]